jgi:hypothetical protein
MKKTLVVVFSAALVFAVSGFGSKVNAQTTAPSRAVLEQELTALEAQLASLEQEAGMLAPSTSQADLLGGDSFLNPAQGNLPDTLSTDSNGNTHVIPNNEKFWTLGDSGTNAQFNNVTVGGSIVQTNPFTPFIMVGPSVLGSVVIGGTSVPTVYTTSTVLNAASFCGASTEVVMNSTSSVTSTISFPTLASVQSSTCDGTVGIPAGGYEIQTVYNSSTANLLINASSGFVFKNFYNPSSTANTSSTLIIPAGGFEWTLGQGVNTTTFFVMSGLST